MDMCDRDCMSVLYYAEIVSRQKSKEESISQNFLQRECITNTKTHVEEPDLFIEVDPEVEQVDYYAKNACDGGKLSFLKNSGGVLLALRMAIVGLLDVVLWRSDAATAPTTMS